MVANKIQFSFGIILVLASIILGFSQLDGILALRLILGLGIGYTLVRGFFGFAGSVNRPYKTGSTKLARYILLLFIIASFFSTIGIAAGFITEANLNVYPINFGLILGATLFGIGMALGDGCASGTLTGFRNDTGRMLVTLITFCFGTFIAFPLQAYYKTVGSKIWLPNMFEDKLYGAVFAFSVTLALCLALIKFTYIIQNKLVAKGYKGITPPEKMQDETSMQDLSLFDKIFVRPFTLTETALILAILLSGLLFAIGKQWGVTTTFGYWGGKALMMFGYTAQELADYTQKNVSFFDKGIFEYGGSVQNIGIIIGAFIYPLMASKFSTTFKMTKSDFIQFGIGGLIMGVGTRLAMGCNAGALFSPITGFSVSGWVFLVFMVIGGILGNMAIKRFFAK